MPANLSGSHLIIILIIVLLLFGAPKLPALARSIGQSLKIFKNEVKTLNDDEAKGGGTAAADTAATASQTDPAPTAEPKAQRTADQRE